MYLKKLILITVIFMTSNSYALPNCSSDISARWHECFGTYIFDEDSEWNGHKYVGEFKNDGFHGQGTYTYANGDKYSGQFLNDSATGQGTLTFASGDTYSGEVKDYAKHGQGTYTWADGDKYSGQFLNDSATGQGIYTFASGDTYSGEVKDYAKHGQGKYTYANGITESGIWENDILIIADDLSSQKDNNYSEILDEAFNIGEFSNYTFGIFFIFIFIFSLLYIYTRKKNPSKNEIDALDETKVFFNGNTRDYYAIWITNVVLMVLTLGIYSAWAKVRNMKYFYQNISIDGHNFDYTARPIQILKGRIIAVIVLLLYSLLVSIYASLSLILPIVFIFVTPWLINQSMRFNMRVTTYRNIRFNFKGNYLDSFFRFIIYPFLSIFTLYIAMPHAHKSINNYIINNTEFGSKKFSTNQKTSAYYNAAALSGLIILVLIISMFILMNFRYLIGIYSDVSLTIVGVIGLYIVLLISGPVYQSQIRNTIFNNSCINNTVYFRSSLTAKGHVFLVVTNILSIIFTLGLAIPWVKIRNAKYFANLTKIYFDTDIESVIQKESEKGSIIADELSDAFDIDVSLG